MSTIIAERSVWEWAETISEQQGEPFPPVLRAIVKAIQCGDLSATALNAPNDDWRKKFLPVIAEAVRVEYAVDPTQQLSRSDGIWALCHRIIIRTPDMEYWIANGSSRNPRTKSTRGEPSEPKTTGKTQRKQTMEQAMREFIANKYPKGIPAGKTDKVLAREYTADTNMKMHERRARRARTGH